MRTRGERMKRRLFCAILTTGLIFLVGCAFGKAEITKSVFTQTLDSGKEKTVSTSLSVESRDKKEEGNTVKEKTQVEPKSVAKEKKEASQERNHNPVNAPVRSPLKERKVIWKNRESILNASVEAQSSHLAFQSPNINVESRQEEKFVADNTKEETENLSANIQTQSNLSSVVEDPSKEIIRVPDANFKKVLNKNIDKNRVGTEDITRGDMEKLRELSIFLNDDGSANFGESNPNPILELKNLKGTKEFKFAISRGIQSIEGLEYAIHLEKVKLSDNEISDLSPLQGLTKLVYLDLHRNRITDISPLSGLVNLEFLDLYNNWIENVKPLSTLVNLKFLDLHYNVRVAGNESNKIISGGVEDISPLATLTKLETFSFSDNRVEDVSVVSHMPNMRALDFVNNKVGDYRPIASLLAKLLKSMFEGESGHSIGFAAQNVDFKDTVLVNSSQIRIPGVYLGIRDLQNELEAALEIEEVLLFEMADSNLEGIRASYDEVDESIVLDISDEARGQYAGTQQVLKLKLYNFDYAWNMNNIQLQFPEYVAEDTNEASGEVAPLASASQ